MKRSWNDHVGKKRQIALPSEHASDPSKWEQWHPATHSLAAPDSYSIMCQTFRARCEGNDLASLRVFPFNTAAVIFVRVGHPSSRPFLRCGILQTSPSAEGHFTKRV